MATSLFNVCHCVHYSYDPELENAQWYGKGRQHIASKLAAMIYNYAIRPYIYAYDS